MSQTITVYIDDDTEKRLDLITNETQRAVSELAEAAISEEALKYFRGRKDDPAR